MYQKLKDNNDIFIWDTIHSDMYQIVDNEAILISCSLEQLSRFRPTITLVAEHHTKPKELETNKL
jgi:hypothetical protein